LNLKRGVFFWNSQSPDLLLQQGQEGHNKLQKLIRVCLAMTVCSKWNFVTHTGRHFTPPTAWRSCYRYLVNRLTYHVCRAFHLCEVRITANKWGESRIFRQVELYLFADDRSLTWRLLRFRLFDRRPYTIRSLFLLRGPILCRCAFVD
jgi:hypothetical protein